LLGICGSNSSISLARCIGRRVRAFDGECAGRVVERHIRGKWACERCETLIQAPVPAHVIDKGIPTAGLLAHIMVAKFADHLPLYLQEKIFGRAVLPIARSTLAQWVGNCGVQPQRWLMRSAKPC
jgi:transposase